VARTNASRHQISHHLWTFHQWCADTDTPEPHRLARTIHAWWPQIEAFILTGITNAASEGINRLIKPEARNAFGFRNPTNQRPRSRCASIRASWRRTKPG
jgi:transposase